MAERTGFEPAEAVNLARFPSVCLKPLDHLSKIFNARFRQQRSPQPLAKQEYQSFVEKSIILHKFVLRPYTIYALP